MFTVAPAVSGGKQTHGVVGTSTADIRKKKHYDGNDLFVPSLDFPTSSFSFLSVLVLRNFLKRTATPKLKAKQTKIPELFYFLVVIRVF